jgi:hypothetical protein
VILLRVGECYRGITEVTSCTAGELAATICNRSRISLTSRYFSDDGSEDWEGLSPGIGCNAILKTPTIKVCLT